MELLQLVGKPSGPPQQVSDRRGESMNEKLSEVRSRWLVCIPSKCTATLDMLGMPNGGGDLKTRNGDPRTGEPRT